MALALWAPFAVGRAGRFDPFADLLDDFFGAGRETSLAPRPPVTKLHSDEDGYTFRFDLPGVTKDDIDISLAGDVLTVSAERKNGKDEDAQVQARYRRSYRLPEDADDSRITADHKDGVLELSVGRQAAPEARRIPVV